MSIKYLYQFIPKKFEYLSKQKTINYKDVNLKTSYIINIIHELILKYYFTNKNYIDVSPNDYIKFNLWSSILRRKYGMHYNLYMNYLIEKEFIIMISDYYVGKKSKTYRLSQFDLDSLIKIEINDPILIKKNKKDYLLQSITSYCNSPIDPNIRKKLVDDIYHVQIDYDESMEFLNKLKLNNNIEINKYYKNLHSINSIKNNYLFFKFDEYGRFHTNFTVLKKEIRQNYLKINNESLTEMDIGNSQPLFLSILIKEDMDIKDPEVNNYIWLTKNSLFYEYLISKSPSLDRKKAKLLTYKVLFGHNGLDSTENKFFSSLFPKIYEYILKYKKDNGNYKSLSHKLQKMESDFIFGKVVKNIYDEIPDIKLITIHDSILFQNKYKEKIKIIFDKNKNELL